MKRIIKLFTKNKTYTLKYEIQEQLEFAGLSWLNDCEIENAILEIKDDKLYWHSGIFFYGTVVYMIFFNGVWKYGNFNGVFHNGIFEDGIFNGIFMNGKFIKGEMKGEMRKPLSENILTFSEFKNNV